MKLLVTGGAGFIGSNFVEFVLEETENDILNLDNLTYAGNLDNLKSVAQSSRHTFIKGDICDGKLVHDLVKQSDAVINFAAETHVDNSITDSFPFVNTNVLGTQILLEAARRTDKKFVHISTDEVYGSTKEKASENAQLAPGNPYSATKAAADLLVISYYNTYKLPVSIVRSGNNFGPKQHTEKFLPKIITRALQNQKLPVYGQGLQRRNWLYVKDNCAAINLVAEKGKPGEIYNVMADNEMPNIEVTKMILYILGKPQDLIEFVPDRPGHDFVYRIDSQKIRQLGWAPRHNFEEALQKTIAWYKEFYSFPNSN